MDGSLISVLSNLGTGGVVIVLIIIGYLVPKPTHSRVLEDSTHKDDVISKLTEALALERQRSNDASQTAAVTNQLIAALTTLAAANRAAEKSEHAEAADRAEARALPVALDLTGRDLGL